MLIFGGTVTATELFPDSLDPAGTWRQRTLLWRSALSEAEWTDLALAMRILPTWSDARRELEIASASDATIEPASVALYWHFKYPPGHEKPRQHHLAEDLCPRGCAQDVHLRRDERLNSTGRPRTATETVGRNNNDLHGSRRPASQLIRPRSDRVMASLRAGRCGRAPHGIFAVRSSTETP